MASELSALRAELWRTRDDLERMKSRTPPSAKGSPRRAFDRRHRGGGSSGGGGDGGGGGGDSGKAWQERATINGARKDRSRGRGGGSGGGGGGGGDNGLRSGRTSPPTSGESSAAATTAAATGDANDGSRGSRRGNKGYYNPRGSSCFGGVRLVGSEGRGSSEEEVAAEETIGVLELEGVEFKNWTEEASSIAVRLIEEVKALRWERASWADREAVAESAAAELRVRAESLEARLDATEAEAKRSQEALLRAQEAEREQAQAAERARSELRAAREREGDLRAQVDGTGGGGFANGGVGGSDCGVGVGGTGGGGVRGGLREELRREKEGADALQRRLDAARAAAARHERERKEWRASAARLEVLRRGLKEAKAEATGHERERRELRASAARLEELRRSWGKQLKKVERKMRHMAKENAALQTRAEDAERARDRAGADASRHRDELLRLAEQRDNLLLGATRAGHLSASSPADALAELLAAAAAGVVAGTSGVGGDGGSEGGRATERGAAAPGRGGGPGREGAEARGGGGEGYRKAAGAAELEAALGRARSEAKAARVAAQQERLRREGEARDKEEAVRQLHRLMGAARRALGRRESRLRSSRLETEVVWNALTEAVR